MLGGQTRFSSWKVVNFERNHRTRVAAIFEFFSHGKVIPKALAPLHLRASSLTHLASLPFSPPGRSFAIREWPFTSKHESCGQRTREQDLDSDHAHPVSPSSPTESGAFLHYSGRGQDRGTGSLDLNSHLPTASLDTASVLATDSPALSPPAAEPSQEMGTSQKTHEDTSSGSPLLTPSGLSLLLARKRATNDGIIPTIDERSQSSSFTTRAFPFDKSRSRSSRRDEVAVRENDILPVQDSPSGLGPPKKTILGRLGFRWHRLFNIDVDTTNIAKMAISSVPAVILGVLLNILDGLSYIAADGMIMFPASGVFTSLGGMGVSLFFLSAVVSQFVYTLDGSQFAGANGSMMIETVPFSHVIASTIEREIGQAHVRLTFLLLGYLRLGIIIGFFPRHILVGCIGGVGVFLVLTGLTVSTRLPSDALDPPTWETIQYLTRNAHTLGQWVLPLVLAILIRVITSRWKHQLIFPTYFLVIPVVFYVIVIAAGFDLDSLRRDGWLFDSAGTTGAGGWYAFYTYFDLGLIKWMPIWNTLPTQFALLFFNVLHPPLNVPALSVSLNQDIDTNKELVGHGLSNLISGLLGSVFYRVGGGSRVAGFMLALATLLIPMIGTAPVCSLVLAVVVVGALIFALGIDLVKEALWDTRYRVSWTEYVTIVSIVVTMTVWDFVIGVLFGIIVSCIFFVVQNSRRRSIRACYSGNAAMSTVRRPAAHRAYIHEVSKQTRIIQLQGFLFFGTIVHVEEKLRSIVEDPNWRTDPVRFIIVDLTLVPGVDMSSAEAFVRVQRLLSAKGVLLVFCGVESESGVGKALANSRILEEKGVEIFESLNDALKWTENEYLATWFRLQRTESIPVALHGRRREARFHDTPIAGSPRERYLRDTANRTIAGEICSSGITPEPLNTLLKAFQSDDEIDHDVLVRLSNYFTRLSLPPGHVLWDIGDTPDGLCVIESGVLRASYRFGLHTRVIGESMVSGSLAGELSGLSGLPRNARVAVEREAVVWWLGGETLRRLEREDAGLAWTFVRMVLKDVQPRRWMQMCYLRRLQAGRKAAVQQVTDSSGLTIRHAFAPKYHKRSLLLGMVAIFSTMFLTLVKYELLLDK
ncbi:sulfate transporter family-domain-containing protein [Pisolithus sp. B1]|nr:sulfate transporter family-domain-containing protein [Pisolithus sp. B1]